VFETLGDELERGRGCRVARQDAVHFEHLGNEHAQLAAPSFGARVAAASGDNSGLGRE